MQALYTWTLVCSASLLLDQTLFVSQESVVAAFPVRLLIWVSRQRLLVIVEPNYTNLLTAFCSWSVMLMDGG